MTIKELRKMTGLTQEKFGEYFGISRRTIQNWEADGASGNGRKCPDYLLELMEYKLRNENAIKGKWILTNSELAEMSCSLCGFTYYGEYDAECMSNFCPDCGADMRHPEN